MSAVPQEPRPPAASYHVVSRLLGPAYFATPVATEGVRLQVIGRDNLSTWWDMSIARANVLVRNLRACPDIVAVHASILKADRHADPEADRAETPDR